MPGLLVAAELILTRYLTESPWIIIFGCDRQVENAGEHVLIQGCVAIIRNRGKRWRLSMELDEKSQKTLSGFNAPYESSHDYE